MTNAELIAKIKEEIERHINHYEKIDRNDFTNGEYYICQELLSFLGTFQVEELPEGLDEAAKEALPYPMGSLTSEEMLTPEPGYSFYQMVKMFKAGAEWMAGQGKTIEKTVGQLEHMLAGNTFFTHGFEIDELDVPFLNSEEVGYGDKVIVQIRKA